MGKTKTPSFILELGLEVAFGQAKRVRFKGKNQLKSVEGKSNKTGIRYKDAGYIEWFGLELKCIIDVNDKVVTHGLSHRVKYCRIVGLQRRYLGEQLNDEVLRLHRLSDDWPTLKERIDEWLKAFNVPSERILKMVGLTAKPAIRVNTT